MEETLTCSQCSKKWKRQRTRGRKPVVCPKCVANNTEPPKINQNQNTVSTEPKVQPKVIADCLKPDKSELIAVYQSLYPKPSKESDQLKNQGSSGTTWKCTHCGYTLVIGVILSDIPTHKCSENSIRVRELQRIS
jgi:ribosomal protein L37AE/L43A